MTEPSHPSDASPTDFRSNRDSGSVDCPATGDRSPDVESTRWWSRIAAVLVASATGLLLAFGLATPASAQAFQPDDTVTSIPDVEEPHVQAPNVQETGTPSAGDTETDDASPGWNYLVGRYVMPGVGFALAALLLAGWAVSTRADEG